VLSERVVRTNRPAGEDRPVDRGDAVTHLVRSMRRRLRVAESHLIAAKYQQRTVAPDGSICLNRNFPGESQKLSSRSTALFRRSTMLYNYIPSAPN